MNPGLLAEQRDSSRNWFHYETFNRIPVLTTAESIATNLDFNVSGTNAVSTSAASNGTSSILLTTAGAANDQVIIGPSTTAGQSGLNTAGRFVSDALPYFEATIRTGTNITGTRIWAGLKLTSTGTIATDADAAFFIYDDAVAAGWQLVIAIGGTKTSYALPTPSPIANVAINTIYTLRLGVQADRSVIAEVYCGTGLQNSASQGNHAAFNVPSGQYLTTAVNFKPFIGLQAIAAAAKTLGVNSLLVGRKFS